MHKFGNLILALGLLIAAYLLLAHYKKTHDPSYDLERLLKQGNGPAPFADTVSIEFIKGLACLPVSVNNSPELPFLLAAGTRECIFDDELARLLQAKTPEPAPAGDLKPFSPPAQIGARLKSVRIGSGERVDFPVTIRNLDWTRQHFSKFVAGILGYRFLAPFEATFDFPNGNLVLTKTDSTPYDIPADSTLAILPLIIRGDSVRNIYIPATVNHKSLLLLLDTMIPDGLLLDGTPDRYQPGILFGKQLETRKQGRRYSIQKGTVARLQLGTITVNHVPAQFSCIVEPEPDQPYPNILGMGVLQQLTMILNFQKQEVIFKKTEHQPGV